MRAVSLPPPILVADEDSLGGLVRALAPYPVVGVDTESNSFHAYRERVCLIQFSTPAVDYIVDPIGLPDLKTLAPFFANPSQQKVFHASEYDLICLSRDYHFEFANIFDTMSAAAHTRLAADRPGRHSRHPLRREVEQEVSTFQLETPPPEAGTVELRAARHALSRGVARPTDTGVDCLRPLAGGSKRTLHAWCEGVATRTTRAQIRRQFWRVKGARALTSAQAAVLQVTFCLPRGPGRTHGPAPLQSHGGGDSYGARPPCARSTPKTYRASPG